MPGRKPSFQGPRSVFQTCVSAWWIDRDWLSFKMDKSIKNMVIEKVAKFGGMAADLRSKLDCNPYMLDCNPSL